MILMSQWGEASQIHFESNYNTLIQQICNWDDHNMVKVTQMFLPCFNWLVQLSLEGFYRPITVKTLILDYFNHIMVISVAYLPLTMDFKVQTNTVLLHQCSTCSTGNCLKHWTEDSSVTPVHLAVRNGLVNRVEFWCIQKSGKRLRDQ